jgi:hypothetical protein
LKDITIIDGASYKIHATINALLNKLIENIFDGIAPMLEAQ